MNRNLNDYLRLFLRSFLQGLIIIGPFAITVWIIFTVVFSIDNLVPSVSGKFPGLIFFIVIFGTTFIGYFGNKFIIGRLIVDGLDYVLEHIPGIKFLYTSLKDVLVSFVGDKKKFNHPVWVKTNENPEIWRIGFLTQSDMSAVTGMSSAEAMKFAVSGGVAGFHSDDNVFKAPE